MASKEKVEAGHVAIDDMPFAIVARNRCISPDDACVQITKALVVVESDLSPFGDKASFSSMFKTQMAALMAGFDVSFAGAVRPFS